MIKKLLLLTAFSTAVAPNVYSQGYETSQKAYQEAWEYCARENQVCNVRGSATVRFGANGQFSYQQVSGPVRCDVANFGDPVPGSKKDCEIDNSGAAGFYVDRPGYGYDQPYNDAGWSQCAREGQSCDVRGHGLIRYGANGQYTTRQAFDQQVRCDNQQFGDPAPGQKKSCEIKLARAQQQLRPIQQPQAPGNYEQWQACAREGKRCRLPGAAMVRYGREGAFLFREFNGGEISCDNQSFQDPAPGQRKECSYRLLGNVGYGQQPQGQAGGYNWQFCAREREPCNVSGVALVRYGAGGATTIREVRGSISCTNESFGIDPAPRQRKNCEVLLLAR